MKKIAALFFVFTGFPGVSFAQYFTDMFTGSAVNAANWRTVAPFADSSVSQGGGIVTLNNRAKLISANSMPVAVDITLKFRFTGSTHDVFRVATRTTGVSTNGSQEFDKGIYFSVQMQSDGGSTANNIAIAREDYPNPGPLVAIGTYPIALNQDYTLRIVDDGTNLVLYVNDTATPFLRGTDSIVLGRQIGMLNREGAAAGSSISAGSQVKISAFTVNAASVVTLTNTVTNTVTVTVPDTSGRLVNLSTLSNNGFTSGFVVAGSTPRSVLIRAVGPTLRTFGVTNAAAQPTLTVYSGANIIGTNAGWSAAPNATQVSNAFGATGAFVLASGSADAAILTSLNPGSYTAQVAGNGAVLLEVYEVP